MHFAKANPHAKEGEYVFILDREKGLLTALEAIFPNAFQSHCCQHICDNVEQRYSVKCHPFFWKCTRAKTKLEFDTALKELAKHNFRTAKYVDKIPHNS
jgi:hypothetical protein